MRAHRQKPASVPACALLGALAASCAGDDGDATGALSAGGAHGLSVSVSSASDATDGGATGDAGSTADASGSTATDGSTTTSATTGAGTSSTSRGDSTGGSTTAAPSDGRAFLHADLWSVWWNDRTRCGAERTFREICQRRGDDCGLYDAAVAACDPAKIVYGQVGPEKQGEALCQRGKHPDVGGCDATKYDFDALRFYWYGAEWQGNWPFATLKIFPQDADWTKSSGETVALSTLPGHAQAAMAGIDNHGLDYGCTMQGQSSGDDTYLKPFGAFAWVEVPTGVPVTVVGAAALNFADNAFAGCSRGEPSQDPWVTAAPGSTLGCVYVEENMVFEPDTHYVWRYGQLTPLNDPAPPADILAGFALPEVALDVSDREACAL